MMHPSYNVNVLLVHWIQIQLHCIRLSYCRLVFIDLIYYRHLEIRIGGFIWVHKWAKWRRTGRGQGGQWWFARSTWQRYGAPGDQPGPEGVLCEREWGMAISAAELAELDPARLRWSMRFQSLWTRLFPCVSPSLVELLLWGPILLSRLAPGKLSHDNASASVFSPKLKMIHSSIKLSGYIGYHPTFKYVYDCHVVWKDADAMAMLAKVPVWCSNNRYQFFGCDVDCIPTLWPLQLEPTMVQWESTTV